MAVKAKSSLAIYVAGVCAPLALIWGVLIAYTRRADMELYASNMHTDLEGMLFTPTEQQDHISDNIAQLRAQRSDFRFKMFQIARSSKALKSKKIGKKQLKHLKVR